MRKSSVQNIQEVAEVLSAAMATEEKFLSGSTIIIISRMLPPSVIRSICDFLLDIRDRWCPKCMLSYSELDTISLPSCPVQTTAEKDRKYSFSHLKSSNQDL